jgi:hypothetical protein
MARIIHHSVVLAGALALVGCQHHTGSANAYQASLAKERPSDAAGLVAPENAADTAAADNLSAIDTADATEPDNLPAQPRRDIAERE